MHRNDYRKRGSVASVDAEMMRRALRQFASGVTVVTAEQAGEQFGITVTAFASISLVPPVVMVSINNESPLRDVILDSEHFAVHILSDSQQPLAERFARPAPSVEKYSDVPFIYALSGAPILTDTLASLDCVLEQTNAIGSHTVMFGRVVDARSSGETGDPLLYYDRSYRLIDGVPGSVDDPVE